MISSWKGSCRRGSASTSVCCASSSVSSRTPLRESFKVLAAEGLIELLPNRGATVAALTIEELNEVVEVLSGLEAVVGPLAVERIDTAQMERLEALYRTMLGDSGSMTCRPIFA